MTSSNGNIFVRGIYRSPVCSLHKGPWRGALVFSLSCAWINSWVNNRKAGDLRRHRTHYDVSVMNHTGNSSVKVHELAMVSTLSLDIVYHYSYACLSNLCVIHWIRWNDWLIGALSLRNPILNTVYMDLLLNSVPKSAVYCSFFKKTRTLIHWTDSILLSTCSD